MLHQTTTTELQAPDLIQAQNVAVLNMLALAGAKQSP